MPKRSTFEQGKSESQEDEPAGKLRQLDGLDGRTVGRLHLATWTRPVFRLGLFCSVAYAYPFVYLSYATPVSPPIEQHCTFFTHKYAVWGMYRFLPRAMLSA